MKKLLLGLLLLFSIGINAQAFTKDGIYTAKVDINNEIYTLRFELEGGYLYHIDKNGDEYERDDQRVLANATTTVFTWVSAGGIWSESQTYIFTTDKESGKIYIQYLRVVQNEGQEPWSNTGKGEVTFKAL